MTDPENRNYIERRLSESRERAEKATDPTVAHVHRQFADGYARLLDTVSEETIGVPAQ